MANRKTSSSLHRALLLAQDYLPPFAAKASFVDNLTTSFGSPFDTSTAAEFQQKWLIGDFSNLSNIEFIPSTDINTVDRQSSGEIYRSAEFLRNSPPAIDTVLLEEIGQALNAQNPAESQGTAGAIFSDLVQTLDPPQTEAFITHPTLSEEVSLSQDSFAVTPPAAPEDSTLAFEAIHENLSPLTEDHSHETEGHSHDVEAFQTFPRWSSTATNGSGLQQGDPTTLTWSVVADGTFIPGFLGEPDAGSDLVSVFNDIYGTTANWLPIFTSVFERWSDLSGVNYVYEDNDDGADFGNAAGVLGTRGDVRIGGHFIDGESGLSTLAYNFFPSSGEMVIDTSNINFFSDTSNNSLSVRNTLAHESGHGLGLSHLDSNNANFLLEPFVSRDFDGPQFDDILGLHRLYGDALESSSGNHLESNDSLASATNLGTIKAGASVSIGTDASDNSTIITANQTDFVSIDDDSDIDFYRFTISSPSSLDVILNPRGPTYNEGPQDGIQTSLNTKTLSDLSLAVFNNNGTLLSSVNNTAAGGSESITGIQLLTAGTYAVQVIGSANNVQLYDLSIGVTSNGVAGIERIGTSGSEQLNGGIGNDTLIGLGGNDELIGDNGNDQLRGSNGNDEITGGSGRDTLLGEGGQDTLKGGEGDDQLSGGSGNDSLLGDANNDTLDGQGGSDTLLGASGDDSLRGASGRDFLQGGIDDDVLSGGGNSDVLAGQAGNDTLFGNSGLDSLSGDAGNDLLQGGLANDELNGGSDNDTLEGQSGFDILLGGNGNDILVGGLNNDTLTGGSGFDKFRFNSGINSLGIDTITDFSSIDMLQLSQSIFGLSGAIGANILASEFASVGSLTAAENSSALITYNRNDGSLYFNANGTENGLGSGGQFARLENTFNLGAGQIELML